MGSQLAGYPKALGMSAAVMAGLAILPGIPMLPFLTLAAGAAYLASDDASFVTATDLLIDGGYVAFKGRIGPEGRPVLP